MNKRLAKLMMLLTALVMVLLPIMTQAESCYLCDRIPINEASRQPEDPYLFYMNDKDVYAGDKVNLEHFELWCDGDLVDPADYTLSGAGNGEVYDTFGVVTVKAVCAQHNRVLHACTVNVLPNELNVTVVDKTYAATVFAADEFVTGATYVYGDLKGQKAEYTVTADGTEIKKVGAYSLAVSAAYAEDAAVTANVVKAQPVINVVYDHLPYTGTNLKDAFGITVTIGDTDVTAECDVEPETIIESGDYVVKFAGNNNLLPAEDVAVKVWKSLAIVSVEGNGQDLYTTNDGVPVIGDNGAIFTISGEPGKSVTVEYNGQSFDVTLDPVTGKATFTLDFVEVDENGVPQVQNLVVYYSEFADSEAIGARATVDFIFDSKDNEPELVLDAPMNRQYEWDIVLPEYGSVTKVTTNFPWIDAEGNESVRGVLYEADVTDEYSKNEDHVQRITLKNIANIPVGEEYTVTFTDLAGHSYTATCEIVEMSTCDINIEALKIVLEDGSETTKYTDPNENKRLINRSDIFAKVIGEPNEIFNLTIGGELYGQYMLDENGECEVRIERNALPRNITISIKVEYVYVHGSNATNDFIVDDVCAAPIILTPVYENAYVIAGVVEVGSVVKISYPQYEELGYIWVSPDPYGFFCAELDMLEIGDQVQIDVFDLGDNAAKVILTAISEDELTAQTAHVMGKLFTDPQNEAQPWMNITKVRVADLKAGVTYPILANNCFEIGEFSATMDENGKVVFDYEIDDSIAELVDSYMTVVNKADFDGLAARTYKAAGEDGIDADPDAKDLWIYAEFIVNLDVDGMVETFQMESLRESVLKQQYIKLQQN